MSPMTMFLVSNHETKIKEKLLANVWVIKNIRKNLSHKLDSKSV